MSAHRYIAARLPKKIFIRSFMMLMINVALILACSQVHAANVSQPKSSLIVPVKLTGEIALSDEAMAATTAQGVRLPASQVATGNRRSITLWDEIKPPFQPLTAASGSVTITLNGTAVH